MSYLFPLQYVYIGNISIAILVLIALQQLCWSPVNSTESPSIRSKVLVCSFCFVTYILNWLLIYHYSFHEQHEPVTSVRLFTCATFCLGAVTTFKFVTTSMDALYKSKKNQNSSPKWFILLWKINMSLLVFSLITGAFCAYYFQNGTFFNFYYIFIDITTFIGCIAILFAMIEIRSRINQIVQNTLKLAQRNCNETSGNAIHYYKKQSRKLRRKRCKFDMIVVLISLGLFTVLYNLYSSIKKLNFKTKTSLFLSPYPTLTDYIIHICYTLVLDSLLILWIYKPCRCCKHYCFRNKKKVKDETGTVYGTPNFENESKQKTTDTSSVATGNDLIVLYLCCPCMNCEDDAAFEDFQQKLIDEMRNDMDNEYEKQIRKERRNFMQQQNGKLLICKDETVTAMPKNSSTIELDGDVNDVTSLVLYNFENLLLVSPNKVYTIDINDTFENICETFGGVNRIRLLGKHFTNVSKKGIKLCVFSNRMKCSELSIVFETLNLLQRFDIMIGYDHKWFDSNYNCSLNERLLIITNKLNDISPNNVLYIDSDVNTRNVEKCNICNVFGVNTLQNLTNDDIKRIEKKLL